MPEVRTSVTLKKEVSDWLDKQVRDLSLFLIHLSKNYFAFNSVQLKGN